MNGPRPPDLRLARRRLLALLDGLPSTGPEWHPVWRLAITARATLVPVLELLNQALDDSPTSKLGGKP